MTYKVCNKCGHQTQSMNTTSCIKCGESNFNHVNEEKPEEMDLLSEPNSETLKRFASHTAKESKGKHARIAIESAKIVNIYGSYIQIIGIVLGVCVAITGLWIASKLSNFGYAIGGILVGALDIAIFAVQGALFRMVSNYVIARLED